MIDRSKLVGTLRYEATDHPERTDRPPLSATLHVGARGTLRWWDGRRARGVITSDVADFDIYVYGSAVRGVPQDLLREGTEVEFDWETESPLPRARRVAMAGGEANEPRSGHPNV